MTARRSHRLRTALLACGTAWMLFGCGGGRRAVVTEPAAPPSGVQEGIASWYGKPYHGRATASGERYDMHALTAAHRTLPFGTRVRVTNLENGAWVDVTITDRGPFVDGRIIDLSYAAAKRLGMLRQGLARVRLEIDR